MAKRDLGERVADAAVRALNYQKHVSPVDVLMGMGMLPQSHFEQWQRGQVPNLENSIQCGARKLDDTLELFLSWAKERGLQPYQSVDSTQERGGESRPLQVSASGNPDIERIYTTRWVSPELPVKEQQRVIGKAGAPKEIVVFSTLRASQCSECEEALPKGEFLTMERGAPLLPGVRRPGSPGLSASGRRDADAAQRQVQRAPGGGSSLQPESGPLREAGAAGRAGRLGKGGRGMPGG